jgi:hypothetical protein
MLGGQRRPDGNRKFRAYLYFHTIASATGIVLRRSRDVTPLSIEFNGDSGVSPRMTG